MNIKHLLLLSSLLSSCSILVRRDQPPTCTLGEAPICEGEALTLCVDGIEFTVDCTGQGCAEGRSECGFCGDGAQQSPEVCDDGNQSEGDGCRADCLGVEVCGDGLLDRNEECDDGNLIDGDGCTSSCKVSICGNQEVDADEECDDGNTTPNDGCDDLCQNEQGCGDGDLDLANNEECDDDNIIAGDGCSSTCTLEPSTLLATGGAFTCAEKNQTFLCFGDNQKNQLGTSGENLGDDETLAALTQLPLLPLRISTGQEHACAINGVDLFCWGSGANGRLGYGNISNIGGLEPININPVSLNGDKPIQVSAGGQHTCVLLSNGRATCWGDNNFGQLGDGTNSQFGDNAGETPDARQIGLGGLAVQIVAGGRHSCAILEGGAVKCWGRAAEGQLGYGNINELNLPIAQTVSINGEARQIVAGGDHTCVLKSDGKVRCWGDNAAGQVGTPGKDKIGDNELPDTDTALPLPAIQITAGERHTCALLSDHTVACWGESLFGRLGYGDTNNIGDDETPASAGRVSTSALVKQIYAGGAHTCALLVDDTIQCWGDGRAGQLGLGLSIENLGDDEDPFNASQPAVALSALPRLVAIGGHHTCAVIGAGASPDQVLCWGDNQFGQLGRNNRIVVGDDEAPTTLALVLNADEKVAKIVAGEDHTCILLGGGVLDPNKGKVRCWGRNDKGQLGYGDTNNIGDNEIPSVRTVDLGLNVEVIDIAAGDRHTCVIIDKLVGDDEVKCWGEGLSGKLGVGNQNLGDNESIQSIQPVVLTGHAPQKIFAGGDSTCALTTSPNPGVVCWGGNLFGQLGLGSSNDIGDNESIVPSGVLAFSGVAVDLFTSLSLGDSHVCMTNGLEQARCWGNGGNGRLQRSDNSNLGDDAGETASTFQVIESNASSVFAGRSHSCAQSSSGELRCWGGNLFGQLAQNGTADSSGSLVVGSGAPFSAVFSGYDQLCGVDGIELRCWGKNDFGQLGLGNLLVFIGDDEDPSAASSLALP